MHHDRWYPVDSCSSCCRHLAKEKMKLICFNQRVHVGSVPPSSVNQFLELTGSFNRQDDPTNLFWWVEAASHFSRDGRETFSLVLGIEGYSWDGRIMYIYTSLAKQECVLCWIMHSFCNIFSKTYRLALHVYFLSIVLCSWSKLWLFTKTIIPIFFSDKWLKQLPCTDDKCFDYKLKEKLLGSFWLCKNH